MISSAFQVFDPFRVILYADNGAGQAFLRSLGLQFISEQSMSKANKATAYICQNFSCSLPTNDLQEYKKMLAPAPEPTSKH